MDRQIVYPGAIPLETDLLNTNKNAMVGLSKLAAAILGTATMLNGFAVTPTGPASLQVYCAPGEIYALANIDGTAYSSLAADTTHSILKQGISLDQVTLSCPAPATAGQSINYLIQVAYQDSDTGAVVLPYYNASNPSQAYSGPENSGASQNTVRKGVANIVVKAGVAATTGSQVTPAPDAGYVGAYVVTVANGNTQILAGNISQYSASQILPALGLVVGGLQGNACNISAAGGTADAITGIYNPRITALTNGMTLYVRAGSANVTTTPTFTPASGAIAAKTIVKGAGAALAAGDIAGGGHWIELQYDLTLDKWVLLNPATGISSVVATPAPVGVARNAKMSVAAASATATFTADEVIVETSLGGTPYRLSNYSQAINLATTGAGGMDTGSAPASGFVSLYAIAKADGTKNILACNASTSGGSIYSGANMPAGYVASALIGVWPTNGSSQFVVGYQKDRTFWNDAAGVNVLNITATPATSYTSVSLTSAVPPNAQSVILNVGQPNSGNDTMAAVVAATTSGAGSAVVILAGSGLVVDSFYSGVQAVVPLVTAQTIYYKVGSGVKGVRINVTGYTF